ncbi:MAG: type I restriction enzyme HsdR N-terminal domain-containing protein [Paludibacteraceae bacterium]
MFQLNLPTYQFRIEQEGKKYLILDIFRKKYVKLTPEEWVRQNFLHFFVEDRGFPAELLAIEKQLLLNGMKKRCDAVFYNTWAEPEIILEFKSPNVKLTQDVFDQVAVYNTKLRVDFFIISNGREHYCCKVNGNDGRYDFLDKIPTFEQMRQLSLRI